MVPGALVVAEIVGFGIECVDGAVASAGGEYCFSGEGIAALNFVRFGEVAPAVDNAAVELCACVIAFAADADELCAIAAAGADVSIVGVALEVIEALDAATIVLVTQPVTRAVAILGAWSALGLVTALSRVVADFEGDALGSWIALGIVGARLAVADATFAACGVAGEAAVDGAGGVVAAGCSGEADALAAVVADLATPEAFVDGVVAVVVDAIAEFTGVGVYRLVVVVAI